MRLESSDIFKVVVAMLPDTVHSEGVDDPLCSPDPVSGRVPNFWEFPKWVIRLRAELKLDAAVPGSPGLGVELDMDAVDRYTVD